MLVALGPIGFCLALMAFMPSLWTTALLVFAFFFAYYVYEPPYRGLYPDLLPERLYGRAQSAQHLMRGARARHGADRRRRALPRLGAVPVPPRRGRGRRRLRRRRSSSCARTAATAASSRACAPTSRTAGACSGASPRCAASWSRTRRWEGTFAGARTFVVLYLTVGLGAAARDDDGGARRRSPAATSSPRPGRAPRRPLRAQPRDLRRVGRLRARPARRRVRRGVARAGTCRSIFFVAIAGGSRDDARLGAALQADAGRRPRRDRRSGDDDEGDRPDHRAAARRRGDRPALAVPRGHARLPGRSGRSSASRSCSRSRSWRGSRTSRSGAQPARSRARSRSSRSSSSLRA